MAIAALSGLGSLVFAAGIDFSPYQNGRLALVLVSLGGLLLFLSVVATAYLLITTRPAHSTGESVSAKADHGGMAQAAGRDVVTKDSNVVNIPGTLQVAGDLNIGKTPSAPAAKDDDAPTARLFMVSNFRGIRLDVTNNDKREDLVVETTISAIKRRPRWISGEPTKELKRGETGSLMIMYLEPNRANMGLTMPTIAQYELERWKARIERGTRLLRVYGNDEAGDNNSEFLVNQVYTLEVAVYSNNHAPQKLTYDFAVSENECLILPYTKEELDRVNSLGLAEQKFLLAYLERKLAERAARKSDG